jgi:hypothetical protein
MAHALQILGLLLLAVGIGFQVAAGRHLSPGRSQFGMLMRGSLQRPEDYTATGWRYMRTGLKVAIVGGVVLVLSLFAA